MSSKPKRSPVVSNIPHGLQLTFPSLRGSAISLLPYMPAIAVAATGHQLGGLSGGWLALVVCFFFLLCWAGARYAPRYAKVIVDLPLSVALEDFAVPAYLAGPGRKMPVKACNRALVEFLSVQPAAVLNKPLEVLINRFAALVPDERRAAFLDKQTKVLAGGREAPSAYLVETVQVKGAFQGSALQELHVTIAALSLQAPQSKKHLGWLVLYLPTAVTAHSAAT